MGRHLAHLQQPELIPPPAALARSAKRPPAAPRRRAWPLAAALLLVVLAGLGLTEAAGVTDVAATVLAFAAEGQRLVSGGADNAIRIHDLATGRTSEVFAIHRNSVYGLAFGTLHATHRQPKGFCRDRTRNERTIPPALCRVAGQDSPHNS